MACGRPRAGKNLRFFFNYFSCFRF